MSINDLMRIQIASFALVPEHIYIAERNFHAEKLILILSDENKNKEVDSKIKEITEFYKKLNVVIEKTYINYKNFMEMTLILAKTINKFSPDDEILLNLSGGRRSIPISLIYAGTFVSNFKDVHIKCVVIPEDKTYIPFNLLPNYVPDRIDLKLMSKVSNKITLIDLEGYLGIKQPTISLRLKRLESNGFVILNGRKRELTDLGRFVIEINKTDLIGNGGELS
ncbi:hypothetical protein LCGC14_1029340 [marine sediment metagenome]|uniref:Csa3 N-terminal domain-containing protein n=1 Tax=marine sediment metagenome TaxID=412755 RepID=A0A0F9MZL4_9ZZZZ|nr:hypothetical protein [bacterium]